MGLEYKLSEVIRKKNPSIEDFNEIISKLNQEKVFISFNQDIGGRTRRGKFLLEYSRSPFGHKVYEFYEMPNVPSKPKEDLFDFVKRWLGGVDPWEKMVEEVDYKEWGFEIQIKDKKITDVYIKRNPFKKNGNTYLLRPRQLYLGNLTNEFK